MADICKMCGCEVYGNKTKIKGGSVCLGCSSTLPIGVRESSAAFNAKQLWQIRRITRIWRSGQVWRRCGGFAVCLSSVVLNGMEYKLMDLRSIQLNFHPREVGHKPNTALGTATIVLETKKPHVLIEEAFTEDTCEAAYVISGMDITYRLSDEIEHVVQCVQAAIKSGAQVIDEALRELQRKQAQAKREKNAEKSGSRAENQKNSRKTEHRQPRTETPLECALRLYGLKQPFTLETLKKRRNDMLRNQPIHPDNGGTDERFKEFQAAYEILLKFTVG